MFEDIMKFIMPIVQQALSGAASQGAKNLMTPASPGGQAGGQDGSIRQLIENRMVTRQGLQSGQQNPGDVTGQGGFVPSGPTGVLGAGSTNKPGAALNFSGGYTGAAQTTPYSQSGFQAMGYPTQDQARMRRTLDGSESGGFQGI